MKKLILTISILAMVMGFAGMAAAQMCLDCGNPGYIDRGCDVTQTMNRVFDYNDTSDDSYCSAKGDVHRAMLDVCECDAEWVDYNWAEIQALGGLSIDISLEILVNGQPGNNGVYWADQNVRNGLMMWTDSCSTSAMCSKSYHPDTPIMGVYDGIIDNNDLDLRPLHMTNLNPAHYLPKIGDWNSGIEYGFSSMSAIDFINSPKMFAGPFIFENLAPALGEMQYNAMPGDSIRTTVMRRDPTAPIGTTGYLMEEADIRLGKCTWGFDVPSMWVDETVVSRGDVVTLRVTLIATEGNGLCHKDDCTCEILIGTLCCPEDLTEGKNMLYPYMPKLNGYYDAQGIAIVNLTGQAGDAVVTIYENDGDAFTKTVTVPAFGSVNLTPTDFESFTLKTTGAGGGVLGTASKGYYVVVETDFAASGLAYFANSTTGESLGYIPE